MQQLIETSVKINASPGKVWRVFSDPSLTAQMGGEYVTDWTVGSAFGWKGKDGKIYTNGTILEIETEKLLKHNLFSSENQLSVISVITYTFEYENGHTTLFAREELFKNLSVKEYRDAVEGWNSALLAVKEIGEKG